MKITWTGNETYVVCHDGYGEYDAEDLDWDNAPVELFCRLDNHKYPGNWTEEQIEALSSDPTGGGDASGPLEGEPHANYMLWNLLDQDAMLLEDGEDGDDVAITYVLQLTDEEWKGLQLDEELLTRLQDAGFVFEA